MCVKRREIIIFRPVAKYDLASGTCSLLFDEICPRFIPSLKGVDYKGYTQTRRVATA